MTTLLCNYDFFLYLFLQAVEDPFGGTQVILVGDLLQLPPVPSYNDRGHFLYCSEAYLSGKFTVYTLTTVHRQQDPRFIRLAA